MREPRVHELKCWPAPFSATAAGRKTFEIRKDDRGFEIGDLLRLREWDPEEGRYMRRDLWVYVTHIERGPSWGLPEGLVVMAIRRSPTP